MCSTTEQHKIVRACHPTSGHMGMRIGPENGFTGTKKEVFGSAQNVATSIWINFGGHSSCLMSPYNNSDTTVATS